MFDVSTIDREEAKNLTTLLDGTLPETYGALNYWALLLPGAHQYCIFDKRIIKNGWIGSEQKLDDWAYAEFIIPNLKVEEPLLFTGNEGSKLAYLINRIGARDFEVVKGSHNREIFIKQIRVNKFGETDNVMLLGGKGIKAFIIKDETEKELLEWELKTFGDEKDTKETKKNHNATFDGNEWVEHSTDPMDRLMDQMEQGEDYLELERPVPLEYKDETEKELLESEQRYERMLETEEEVKEREQENVLRKEALVYGRWLRNEIKSFNERNKSFDDRVILSFMLQGDELDTMLHCYKLIANKKLKDLDGKSSHPFDGNCGLLCALGVDEVWQNVDRLDEKDDTKVFLLVRDEAEYDTYYKGRKSHFESTTFQSFGGFKSFHTLADVVEKKTDKELLFYFPYINLFRLPIQSYGIEIYTLPKTSSTTEQTLLYSKFTGLLKGDVYYVPACGILDWEKWSDVKGGTKGSNNGYKTRSEWLDIYRIRDNEAHDYYTMMNNKYYALRRDANDYLSKFTQSNLRDKKKDEKEWIATDNLHGATTITQTETQTFSMHYHTLSAGVSYWIDKETYEKELAHTMRRRNLTRDKILTEQKELQELAKFDKAKNDFRKAFDVEQKTDAQGNVKNVKVWKRPVPKTEEELKDLSAITKEVERLLREQNAKKKKKKPTKEELKRAEAYKPIPNWSKEKRRMEEGVKEANKDWKKRNKINKKTGKTAEEEGEFDDL